MNAVRERCLDLQERLSSTRQENRDSVLRAASFEFGQLVVDGALPESKARELLLKGAQACGLVEEDGEHTAEEVISSNLESGKQNPRQTLDQLVGEEISKGGNQHLPPPPPVPLKAFPPRIAALLNEASEAFTVQLQIPAACLLGMLSCLVGGTRLISLRPSWKEPGNIWIATVAASGIGKTPCTAAFFRPIKNLEHEAHKAWKEGYADYETELELCKKQRANAKSREDMPDKPTAPKQRQACVDDATVEALGEALADNPRGIMWRKDELSGLVSDMDKYAGSGSVGGTRARLLSSYDGQEWKTSRTSNPARNLYIPHAYVGIFGGIQPVMLAKVFETGATGVDEASGFLQRFMLIRAERDKPSYWTEKSLTQNSKELLEFVSRALWAWDIEHDENDRPIEKVVLVSGQAKAAFVEWFDGIAKEEFLSQNAALLSKLKGQAQRLCLLLHCLDAALAGNDGMHPVTEDTMRRALLLANWIKEHQTQCWRLFSPGRAKQVDPVERAIMAVVVDEAVNIEADGWRIESARLHALVEQQLGMSGTPKDTVAKAASRLGLASCWMNKGRARKVPRDKIESFKTAVVAVVAVVDPSNKRGKPTMPAVAQVLSGVVASACTTPNDNSNNTSTTPAVAEKNLKIQEQTTATTATTPVSRLNSEFKIPVKNNLPDQVVL
ncbi:MAG: YfjI family protein [Cystobacterineae bacterium]|nr:YfjI family protein [Cystobacterineae bacterium]